MAMINPNGIVDGNSQNIPEANVPRTRSTFPLNYHLFNTHRFGELTPHYVEDCVKGDKLPIQSRHDIRSYTLAAPLMQNVKRNKDYFMVPMECILPRNWEKFFDNPVRGDDVLDDVGPSVENFWLNVGTMMEGFITSISTAPLTVSDEVALAASFRFMITGEYFYSNGSLMSSLGCHGAPYCDIILQSNGLRYTWDELFDTWIKNVIDYVASFKLEVDGNTYFVLPVIPNNNILNESAISLRHALSLMRDNLVFTISQVTYTSNMPANQTVIDTLKAFVGLHTFVFTKAEIPFDASRLWAYQLCCAHYMSNDHIDFVYSAELFRQLIGYYTGYFLQATYSFSRNGVSYQYDFLSGHFLDSAFYSLASSSGTEYINFLFGDYSDMTNPTSRVQFVAPYFSALFAYRRSLRYLDYFTGTRSQPLAVVTSGINTNVSVNNNAVSVIDITKSIQAQRFLNAVNRVRHNFEGYLKGIFGGEMPAPDYHNPFYVAHTDDVIFGQETENTGAAQVDPDTPIAITTNLRGNSGNYVFNVEVDRPCIVIGITSYDITRVYSKSIERNFFKTNRFDYFNPFMQYVGDQPVYVQELGMRPGPSNVPPVSLANFSYSLRHMEYKQRYSQCAGGFVKYLPNWLFTALDSRGDQSNINPDWIRALPCEFDRFYKVLSGYSLATYFHFIVDDYNSCNASRPMAYAPNIL